MVRQRGLAVTLTAIVILSTIVAGIGAIPQLTAGASTDNVNVTGSFHYHDGSPAVERKVVLKDNNGTFSRTLTNKTGGFNLSAPENESLDLVFEQFNSTSGEDFMRDGRPDFYAVGSVHTKTSDIPLRNISLHKAHILNVTIVNASGTPVPNATIYLAHQNNNAVATNDAHTNQDGKLVLNGTDHVGVELNGTVEIYVNGPSEYGDNQTQLTVNQEKHVELTIKKGFGPGSGGSSSPSTSTLNGIVIDANGNPTAGDTVAFEGDSDSEATTTGTQGNFTAEVTSGETYEFQYYQGRPAPDDNISDLYTFGTVTPQNETVDLGENQLPPAQNLTVEVVRTDGTPVENATVNVHQHNNGDTIGISQKTGSSGITTLDVVTAETGVHVEPPSGSNLTGNSTHFTLSGDTTKQLILRPSVNITGQVITSNGTGAANWQVVGHPDDTTIPADHSLTDQEGRFLLSLTQNATYELGFRQYNPNANTFYPKDGIPDLAVLQRFTTGTTDKELDTHQLPFGHQFNVTILKPNGEPATSLNVHVGRVRENTDLDVGTEATTNTNGQVILEGASNPGIEANGTIHVNVDSPQSAGFTDVHKHYTVESDGNATIRLEETLDVNGTILKPDGTAAAEERIEVDSIDESGGDATYTDANGTFSVGVSKTSDYYVGFTQVAGIDQYEPAFTQDGVPDVYAVTTVGNKTQASLGTVKLPDPHNLTVNVVNSNGTPVSNAQVNLGSRANNARHWAHGTTNSNGTLTAEVVGPLNLHVEPPTDALTANGTHLIVDNDTTVTVRLQNATTVTGQVRDANGDTVSGRHVALWGESESDGTVTTSTGNFTLRVAQNETYGLIFRGESQPGAKDFKLNDRPDVYVLDELTTKSSKMNLGEVPLPEGHRLNVTVVDSDGNPIPKASVHIEHDIGPRQVGLDSHTDDTGRFVVNGHYGAEVNGNIQIHVQPPEGSSFKQNSTELSVTSDRNVTITLTRGVPVSGHVEYADGTDVAGYTMELQGTGGDNQLTDASGSFELHVQPNSTYTLGFKQTDWQDGKENFPKDGRPDLHAFTSYSVGDSADSVGSLTLPQAHLVNVTVVNSSGQPVSGVKVDLTAIEDSWREHHPGTTNADGEVVLDGATTPGIEVNGTLGIRARANGQYAQNYTQIEVTQPRNVTLVVQKRANVSTQFVDATGSPITGSRAYASDGSGYLGRQTNETGNVTLPTSANKSYTIGLMQYESGLTLFGPRDNVTDLYEAATVETGTADQTLDTKTIPNASGVLDVRVVNELGEPVKGARVGVFPNQQGGELSIGWVERTNSTGYFISDNAGNHGVEATGNNTIRVLPPTDSKKYVDKTYLRNVTVTDDRSVTVTLELASPVVTSKFVDANGDPITTGDAGIFNFSRNFIKSVDLASNGSFKTTTPNGTFTFIVSDLQTGDGTVDAWSVDRDVSGDTNIGTVDLPRGYNVTLNATEADGSQADTRISVLGGNNHWVYEYASGQPLDAPFFNGLANVQTRELSNGTHNVTIYDAWTHDKLKNTTLAVNGSDRSETYTVDQFADVNLSSADGLTVVRDLQSPNSATNESLINEGVNVRLNVLNATQNDTIITETLPVGYSLNKTYGVQYDGSGTVDWQYYSSNRVIELKVSGDVEDIRYRAEPTADPGNAIKFKGAYTENGTTSTEKVIGQSVIYGEEYKVTGTILDANGEPRIGTTTAIFGELSSSYFASDVMGADGNFSVNVQAGQTVDLQLYQGDYTQAETPVPNRDGTADVYAADQFNRLEHLDIGEIQLPVGHVLNVSVVNESGAPVPNATLRLEHQTAAGADAGISNIRVDENGFLHLDNTTAPGIELNGTVNLWVVPPNGYTVGNNTKSLTVTKNETVEFVLNSTDTSDGETSDISITSAVVSDTSVTTGEYVTVSVTLKNTGDVAGDTKLTFRQDTALFQETVASVPANSEVTVTVNRSFAETGTYNITVERNNTDRLVDAGTVTVTESSGPSPEDDISVTNASLMDKNITTGTNAVIDVTVANNASSAQSLNVTLYVDGEPVATPPVSVDATSTKTITLERPFEKPGTYNLSVNNEALPSLEVHEPETTPSSTPGFSVGTGITALLGAVLLLRRR